MIPRIVSELQPSRTTESDSGSGPALSELQAASGARSKVCYHVDRNVSGFVRSRELDHQGYGRPHTSIPSDVPMPHEYLNLAG